MAPLDLENIKYAQTIDKPGASLFVMGCGVGRVPLMLAQSTKHVKVIANDQDQGQIKFAREQAKAIVTKPGKRFRFIHGDGIDALKQLQDNSLNQLVCDNVIHFFSPTKIKPTLSGLKKPLCCVQGD